MWFIGLKVYILHIHAVHDDTSRKFSLYVARIYLMPPHPLPLFPKNGGDWTVHSLFPTGDVDYEAINTTISFPTGSSQGDTVCAEIGIIDRRAFQSTRSFTIHIIRVDASDVGIIIQVIYARVIIINIDCEFTSCLHVFQHLHITGKHACRPVASPLGLVRLGSGCGQV